MRVVRALLEKWTSGNETEQEELLASLDEKIAQVRSLTVDAETRSFGEELRAFVEKTIDDNQKLMDRRDNIRADAEDLSPDNQNGMRKRLLLDFLRTAARNADVINDVVGVHSREGHKQRKAFLDEIMVFGGDVQKAEAAMEYQFGRNQDEMTHMRNQEQDAQAREQDLEKYLKEATDDAQAFVDGATQLMPDYAAAIAGSKQRSLDTVIAATADGERKVTDLLDELHADFDSALNVSVSAAKRTLDSNAADIIQLVQASGDEVKDSANMSRRVAVEVAA